MTKTIVGLLLVSVSASATPQLSCVQSGGGYAITVNQKTLNQDTFDSEDDCQRALSTGGPTGLICFPDNGAFQPYDVRRLSEVRAEYDYPNLDECIQAVDNSSENSLCLPGPQSGTYAIYDLSTHRFSDTRYIPGLYSCTARITHHDISSNYVNETDAGGSMSHVAVRDQGMLAACYAEAAAQMVDAYRFTHGDTRYDFQTSGIVANSEHDYDFDAYEQNTVGGDILEGIGTIIKHGACNMKMAMDESGSDTLNSIYKMLWTVRGTEQKYLNDGDSEGYQQWLKNNSVISQFYSKHEKSVREGIIPNQQTLLSMLSQSDPKEVTYRIVTRSCTGQNVINPNIPESRSLGVNTWSTAGLIKYFTSHITSSKSLPIGIDYCANVIDKPTATMILQSGYVSPDCGKHASLVVGKRRGPRGQTQLLVRNSWGANCGGAKAWQCDGKGDFWIDAGALAANIFRLAVFVDVGGI